MTLPGSNLWHSSLMGWTQSTDLPDGQANGGVILFKDGTLWSYEGVSPAGGDALVQQGQTVSTGDWFTISEKKPDSDVWERLMPDTWGSAWNDQPPSFPGWPSNLQADPRNPALSDFTGPLDIARLDGLDTHDFVHILDPDDDDDEFVYFHSRFGYSFMGTVIKVNRHERTWERFEFDAWRDDSSFIPFDESDRAVWLYNRCNVVIGDGYFWFFTIQEHVATFGAGDFQPGGSSGVSNTFVRVPLADPSRFDVMHVFWDGEDLGGYADGAWRGNFATTGGMITTNSENELPDLLDNSYVYGYGSDSYVIAYDDGWIYIFQQTLLWDSRTTFGNFNGGPSEKNYNVWTSHLRRFKIGEYKMELLLWHASPKGYVGIGGKEYGTHRNATIGVTNQPDGTASYRNDYPAIGMGLMPSAEHTMTIRDGWLYWIDESANNTFSRQESQGFRGGMEMICRLDLAKVSGSEPIQHDVMNPIFEIISNGANPDEGNWGHWGNGGTRIWLRGGFTPIMPVIDHGALAFDEDGNILYKGLAFPNWYTNEEGQEPFGIKGIWKLKASINEITNVTVKFSGNELKGYSPVREIPVTRGLTEVELS